MTTLVWDTATSDTVAALDHDGDVTEAAHRPAADERPGHASQLLTLATQLLDAQGLTLSTVDRVGAGVGPGTFTGLRIGVATARAVAQGIGAELVAVPTLKALARGVEHDGPVLACLDARRGEAFVAIYHGDDELLAPRAVKPEELAGLDCALAVGDGAVRFRDHLQGVEIVDRGVGGVALAELARTAEAQATILPDYVRDPDAQPRRP